MSDNLWIGAALVPAETKAEEAAAAVVGGLGQPIRSLLTSHLRNL